MTPVVFVWPAVPKDPFAFWRNLHPHPRAGFLLGSGAGTKDDPVMWMSVGEPNRILQTNSTEEADPLESIERSLDRSGRPFAEGQAPPGFRDGASVPRFVGYLGFDAGRLFDAGLRRLPPRPDPLRTPVGFLGDYRDVLCIDFRRNATVLYSARPLPNAQERLIGKISHLISEGHAGAAPKRRFHSMIPARSSSRGEFFRMVKEARSAIRRGDIYQANLSLRFENAFDGDPLALYQALCRINPSPYACLLKCGPRWIVSNSPELLIRVKGRALSTRPIAGTRPRGNTRRADRRLQGRLLLSPKERAEHLMLLDLERNDLGRVCAAGSVRVKESYAVERYSHVMHIVSEVAGTLAPRKTAADALRSAFPGGTITGCPKIKSIEIIEALEKVSRSIFYGSAGFFCWNGDATFNILIRTALLQNRRITFQAGAGIVADSSPSREYNEVLAKAGALMEAMK